MTDASYEEWLEEGGKVTDFNEGDLVRVRASGFVGLLENINPNPNYVQDDEYWADVVSDDWDSRAVDAPDEIEFLMDAKAASERELPSAKTILGAIDFLDTLRGDLTINESETDGPDAVLVYGKSVNGLSFCARIVVESVDRIW